jgi:hypothetical protein
MRKRILVLTLILAILAFAAPGQAQAVTDIHAAFSVGSHTYSRYGYLYNMDVAPFIENNRTYIPIRFIAHAIGISNDNIAWDPSVGSVTLVDGSTVVSLTVGSTIIYINGSPRAMDASAIIRDDRTFLPARYVAEAFDKAVYWSNETKSVQILWDEAYPPSPPPVYTNTPCLVCHQYQNIHK